MKCMNLRMKEFSKNRQRYNRILDLGMRMTPHVIEIALSSSFPSPGFRWMGRTDGARRKIIALQVREERSCVGAAFAFRLIITPIVVNCIPYSERTFPPPLSTPSPYVRVMHVRVHRGESTDSFLTQPHRRVLRLRGFPLPKGGRESRTTHQVRRNTSLDVLFLSLSLALRASSSHARCFSFLARAFRAPIPSEAALSSHLKSPARPRHPLFRARRFLRLIRHRSLFYTQSQDSFLSCEGRVFIGVKHLFFFISDILRKIVFRIVSGMLRVRWSSSSTKRRWQCSSVLMFFLSFSLVWPNVPHRQSEIRHWRR